MNEIDIQQKIAIEELESNKFTEELISQRRKIESGEVVGTEGFWQEVVLNFLREKALNFIGTTLKKLAIDYSVDFAKWLLEQLQILIISKYQDATEEEKKAFKDKLIEAFPDSEIISKLN